MKMGSRIRSFIAIELAEKIVNNIIEFRRLLACVEGKVRWVAPQNMHLTLKFLGEINREDIPKAIETIEKAVQNAGPFELSVEGTGAFPSLSNPRVLWVGVKEPKGILKDFFVRLNNDLAELGVLQVLPQPLPIGVLGFLV